MSGLKNSITNKIWIDQYPDGSLRIVDDGINYETDRVEINFTKIEFEAIMGTYLLEKANWDESQKKEDTIQVEVKN